MKRPFFLKGFTIPELLVSLSIFSVVIVGAGGILVSAISMQKRSGAQQELMDQASYLAEYMSRALRQARKDSVGSCLTTSGVNYEITHGGQGIKFINNSNQCQEFFLVLDPISGEQRMKEIIFPSEAFLTSNNLQVTGLGFAITGEGQDDDLQPKATFTIELKGKVLQSGFQPVTRIQTTVSQRTIDVPE